MHDCFAVELTGECLKCSFRLTRGGPYLRGVVGSTVGAYPRGTGSNPVEGNGHFFTLEGRLAFIYMDTLSYCNHEKFRT